MIHDMRLPLGGLLLGQDRKEKEREREKEREKENIENNGRRTIICPGHSRAVPDLAFSLVHEDEYFLISSCLDGKPMLRDGKTGDWIGTFAGHKGAVLCARLNATLTRAITASADYTARLWDAGSGDEIVSLEHKQIVKAALFDRSGLMVFTGGNEKLLRIFDLNRYDSPSFRDAQTQSITHLVSPPDPNLIMSIAPEKCVRIWDKRTLHCVKTLPVAADMTSLSLSMDDAILCGTSAKDVVFWDAHTLEFIRTFKFGRDLSCVSINPSRNRFITTGSNEVWVREYDYQTGDELACHKGHHGTVRCLAFDPFGQAYASGSDDGTIRIHPTSTSLPIPSCSASSVSASSASSSVSASSVPSPSILTSSLSSADSIPLSSSTTEK